MELIHIEDIEGIRRLVGDLVTSGKEQLDVQKLKALKDICKKSDDCVRELYKHLIKWLKKKHAEIRLSSFQIVNEIFNRSHCFRCLVIRNFLQLVKLVINGISRDSLPEPIVAAKKLSIYAIKTVNEWNRKYGEGYYELELGHQYLRKCKHVNYERNSIITPHELKKIVETEDKERLKMVRKITKITNEIDEYNGEIENSLRTFENCFQLIIPNVHQFQVGDDNDCEEEDNNDVDNSDEHGSSLMQRHGFNKETTVQVNLMDINKVKTTTDNEILINTLKDQVTLITKNLLPKVRSWEAIAMPYASTEATLMKKIIDIKWELENVVKRYGSVSFLPPVVEHRKNLAPDSESDDDFVDVPMEDSEFEMLGLSNKPFLNVHTSKISAKDLSEAGPSGLQELICTRQTSAIKTSSHIDDFCLNEWEPSITLVTNPFDSNQIWSANEGLHDNSATKASNILGVSTQIIDYERQFEAVKWECRAPLRSGKLCPRRDREICPLHGPIISRNESGKPKNASDIVSDNLRREEKERKNPAWQDPSLLADIKRQTGIDLDVRKGKRRKTLYNNLTSLHKTSARNRLKKKIFSRKALNKLYKT